jgi:hypothetical protein
MDSIIVLDGQTFNNFVNSLSQPVNGATNNITYGQLLLFVLVILMIWKIFGGNKK